MTKIVATVAALACWAMALSAGLPVLAEAWLMPGQRHATDVCWSELSVRRAPGEICDGIIQQGELL